MTLSVTPQASPLAAKLVQQTAASATADDNVTGGAGSLLMIEVDNSANVAPVWFKGYDNPSPTVGTDPADWVVRVAAGARRALCAPEGLAFAALSFVVVGGAAEDNVTPPTNPVIVRLVTA